jgi:succinate dehydrogenase / fumarate reductase cytochrome b subunit
MNKHSKILHTLTGAIASGIQYDHTCYILGGGKDMTDNITTTIRGYLGYRGKGHYAFLMHRISGLATFIFLTLHIATTSTVFLAPDWYTALIRIFRNPIVMVAEIFMAFFVVYHGVNGFRIAYNDLFHHELWAKASTRRALAYVFITTFLLWLPALGIMGYNLLKSSLGLFGGE